MRCTAVCISLALVLSIFGCKTSAPTLRYSSNPKKNITYHVILMGGQSNMVGQGRITDLEEAKLPRQVKYFNFGRSASLKQHTDTFGPEVGIARVLSQEFPDEHFLLIKYECITYEGNLKQPFDRVFVVPVQ